MLVVLETEFEPELWYLQRVNFGGLASIFLLLLHKFILVMEYMLFYVWKHGVLWLY